LVKKLYKKQNGVEFSRKPFSGKSMVMKKLQIEMNKELQI
jgi:hypothetical protein